MNNDLNAILEQFSHLKVLVIGEAILDSYVRGKAERFSLEAPAPVVDVTDGQDRPGGAANVALTARRLGAQVELLSVIGKDAEGDTLLEVLRREGVGVKHILRDSGRRTLLKRRVYAGSTLLVRYEQGTGDPIDEDLQEHLLDKITRLYDQADVLILSDYGQGLLPQALLDRLAVLQDRHPCAVVADTRRLEAFRALRLAAVRPSYFSALDLISTRANGNGNGTSDSLEKLSEAGEKILNLLDTQMVAITLDDNGALVLDRDSSVYRTYAPTKPFNRVNGAGDAFIAALGLGIGAGAQSAAAAEIASALGEIVVEKGGLPACCIEELKAYLSGDQKLVQDWNSLDSRLEALRLEGKRIVFTNGVFDILHSGHVNYLGEAKALGDVLVIGVNADESVRRLKGPSRPINTLLERCRVLAGLSCVDFVVPFSEDTPINLIHHVRPHIYVKGGDYTRNKLPEADVVESYGGQLCLMPYIENHSTTGVIERIRKLYGNKNGVK